MYDRRPDGEERYLPTNSGQTAFSLTAGRYAQSAFAPGGALNIQGTGGGVLVNVRPVPLNANRGFFARFFGTGTADTTFDYKVWRITRSMRRGDSALGGDSYGDALLSLFASGTCTLGTGVGGAALAADGVITTEKLCDTVTMTLTSGSTSPAGVGSMIRKGDTDTASMVVSAADNANQAEIFVADLLDAWGYLLEFDLTGATGANAMIQACR